MATRRPDEAPTEREQAEHERVQAVSALDEAALKAASVSKPTYEEDEPYEHGKREHYTFPAEELDGYQIVMRVVADKDERRVRMEVTKKGSEGTIRFDYIMPAIREGEQETVKISRVGAIQFDRLCFHSDDQLREVVNGKLYRFASLLEQYYEDHSALGKLMRRDRETIKRLIDF
ncbi:hypothetical protein HY464_02620 [Candidatus Peregrinibacteria bacterium]|nr:hypothetical protein [Candidatus Peregrinibacteria bacterium]